MSRVPTAKQGKQGKWPKKIPVSENTGILEILSKHRENTGNCVSSSFKYSYSKSKGYYDSCRGNFHFFHISIFSIFSQKLDRSAKSVSSM